MGTISGKKLTAKLNATVIAGNYAWSVDEGGDVLDKTVGADNGWENEEMGVQNLHGTIKLYLDIATGAYATVRRGTILAQLKLYRALADAQPAFSITSALVTKSTQGAEVKGRFEVTIEFHSQGDVVTANEPGAT